MAKQDEAAAPTPTESKLDAITDTAASGIYKATEVTYGAINKTPFAEHLKLPALSGTAGIVLATVVGFALIKRKGPLWLKLIAGFVAVGLLGGAYMGWVRRQTGLGDELLTSPQAIIQDAEEVVRDANARQEQLQKALDGVP